MSRDILDPPDQPLCPEDMPRYRLREPREYDDLEPDSELWERIKALWAADDKEGLQALRRELEAKNDRP